MGLYNIYPVSNEETAQRNHDMHSPFSVDHRSRTRNFKIVAHNASPAVAARMGHTIC